MGKPAPRKTRGVVGIEEDSEDDDKPVAQTMRPRQSHDGGDAAADRAPKRQRTASEDGARRARGAAATDPSADYQQAHPAAETVAAAAAAAADAMEVDEQEQQQQQEAEAAAHPQQHNSKEPDTPFAVAMEGAFPALPHAHSSGDGAAAGGDAAAAAAGDAAPAAAGSGRQRHSSRQHKAVQQQQLQPERTVSRSLSSRPSYKLGNKIPGRPQTDQEKVEMARLPWHGADDNWGEGVPGTSGQLPPGAEAVAEPPLREASVGWGIWEFCLDPPPEGEQQPEEQDEQQQEAQKAEQPQGPVTGKWYRGMVWWFSSKEGAYKLLMEDGEYLARHSTTQMIEELEKGEFYFSRPPCNWPPPQYVLGEQHSGMSADAEAEQQQHEQEAAASGKRAKQQKHKQGHRKPQQQQQQQQVDEEPAALDAAEARAPDDETMQPASAAAEQPQPPAKQQHHKQQQQQQRPHSGQQHKKQQQQQPGPHSQGQKQRKHSAGAAGGSRPAGSKPQPPASPGLPSAEAAAAAATAAAAGLSPQKAAAAAGQQRARSASARPLQLAPLRQQQPDLSGLSADAARMASCLLKLRDGTELVKQGLALQKQALQELPTDLTSEKVLGLAREVRNALSVGEDKTGVQLMTTVKHLAEDHWGLLPGSQEVHGGAEQLYQQMLQKRKPPGTPSKAAAAVKQEGEWAAAAAAGGSSASLQDLDPAAAAAGPGGGLGKRGRDGSVKQEHAAAAAAEQPSPSYQQDAEEPGAAAGVDGSGKGAWDLAHFQSLVPVRCLDDPLRDKAVALLSAVLQPPAAASPFALAHELEAQLHDQHGMIGPGKHMYLRHLYMIWCVLGGRELAAAAEAAQRARAAAAAEGGEEDAAAAAAAGDKAAAAARAELEGVPGVADAAAVRSALLEGAASVEELFDMTRTQLGFDQQRDK